MRHRRAVTRPTRIQRRRAKGWRMPAGAVYVGRGSKWGNPYRLDAYRFAHADGSPAPFDETAAREMALRDFRMWLEVCRPGREMKAAARRELRGKHLACWCPLNQPCHADILMEIANGPADVMDNLEQIERGLRKRAQEVTDAATTR